MKWYLLENSETYNLPDWVRTFGIDEYGIVFMAFAVTQLDDSEAYPRIDSSSNPDLPSIQYNDHLFLPCHWLSEEFPEIADICGLIESQATKTIAQTLIN